MDGVIIDSEPAYEKRRDVFFENKKRYAYDEVRDNLRGSNVIDMFAEIIPDDPEEREKYIENYRAFKNVYSINFLQYVDKDIYNLLHFLKRKQMKIGLASSSGLQSIRTILNDLNIISYFEMIVSGEQFPRSKPDPEIYLYSAKKLHVIPANCLVVEDSEYGIRAAKRAGMTVAAKKVMDQRVNQSEANVIVDTLLDVEKLVCT